MTIHLDITQLLLDPRRTGIQRAERELILHWPGPAELRLCRFDPATNALHELPDSLRPVLCADASPYGIKDDLRRLAPHLAPGRKVAHAGLRLLNLELFPDPCRAHYYCDLAAVPDACISWLVYDFLPWLEPQWFGAGAGRSLMPFMRALLAVRRLAFISPKTRADFAGRVQRRPSAGPVISMGADGLELPRQPFRPGNREFVMLGSIEARKNAAPAMQAFRLLWREGVDAGLTMIGAVSPEAAEEQSLLRGMQACAQFRYLANLPDAGVRQALKRARAMLFPSEGEGFGIPPLEALYAGIPVIVSAGLPALDGVSSLGQVRLPGISAETIADAVRALLDDRVAGALWEEASRLELPTWRGFAHRMAEWVQEG